MSIGSIFGDIVGGLQGSSAKPQGANIQNPITQDQLNFANAGAQSGMNQQQAFINATQAQNGLGNQNQVFQQQQALANQMQGLANGTGPNPAQDMLNQSTRANVANQSALMAGQRGAGANVGMMARQAAMQGANTQQQAAGQAATMASQQQIAGMGALQNQQANMGNMANQQVGQQANALQGYNNAAQNMQGQYLNAQGNFNNANVNMQGNMNNNNAQLGMANQQMAGKAIGGAAGGAGSFMQMMAAGGEVKPGGPMSHQAKWLCMDDGGKVPGTASVPGDSLRNDKVPAQLSPGEIVVPRHITQGKDAAKKSAAFVAAILARKGKGRL